jgi:hypothetical protein
MGEVHWFLAGVGADVRRVNVRAVERDQQWLMPPSLREWLPGDHLAWFILDVVAELDLSGFFGSLRPKGRGGASPPRKRCSGLGGVTNSPNRGPMVVIVGPGLVRRCVSSTPMALPMLKRRRGPRQPRRWSWVTDWVDADPTQTLRGPSNRRGDIQDQPNVKQYASTPASWNSTSKRRSAIGPGWRIS